MNHLAAFILRLAATSGWFRTDPRPGIVRACTALYRGADRYDETAPVNAPGGEA